MSGGRELPVGFVASGEGPLTLIMAEGSADDVRQAGLDRPGGWRQRLAVGKGPSGRGATARVELPSGRVARLKRLRRGGWAAVLWRDRFVGTRRVLDNLRLPVEVARRGVATPAPLALLLERGPWSTVRAWLATDDVEEAIDLRSCCASGRGPTATELDSVMVLVKRMHDAGLDHRDLNLGNLLIRRGGHPADFVIDLDGSRLHTQPLAFARRQRALRRLERSYVKSTGSAAASEELRNAIYERYAGDDRALAARLARGRRAGRFWIGLHRLGWRR